MTDYDHDLKVIIAQAIPLRTCPQDRANDIARRAWLLLELKKYLVRQLENQFNAKEV